MFQFPAFAPALQVTAFGCRVTPFGHPRITGYLRLPAAFRSLSRPSSPLRATGIPRALFLTFSCSSSSYVFLLYQYVYDLLGPAGPKCPQRLLGAADYAKNRFCSAG